MISISVTAFALFWFIAEETGLIKGAYLLAYLGWTALVVLSQVLDLGALTWVADRPFTLRVELPFGLHFQYKEVDRGVLLVVIDFVGFFLMLYLGWVVAKYRRQGNRAQSYVLFFALGVIILAESLDFFIGIGLLSFVFVMEYAWLTVILVVGLRRSNEITDAIQTKKALQKSDRDLAESQALLAAIFDSSSDLIWSVDSGSFRLLAFNGGLRDRFRARYGIAVAAGLLPEELFPSEPESRFWRDAYERAKCEGAYSVERASVDGSSVHQIGVNLMERDGMPFGLSVFAKDITGRKEAEDRIRRSLSEKETLLQELYHRTKNNMNVIISMLKLQSRETGDPRLTKAFAETEGRIISMSLVHEKLYESHDLSRINLREYFEDLAKQVLGNYGIANRLPSLALDLEDVYVAIDTAVSCGLIVNELISNALKYAFPDGREGKIGIGLSKGGDGEIVLVVSDDGVGPPPGFDAKRDGHLGMRLIENIARGRIRAEVAFDFDRGASCRLRFREE